MTRLACLFCLVSATFVIAQPPTKDVGTVLGVQRAIATAREHLTASRPAQAVAVLETELVNASDNPQFLAVLQAAYTAHVRDLELQKADAESIELVCRRLRALDRSQTAASKEPALGPGPAADIQPPAPPIPEAPARLAAPASDPFRPTPYDNVGESAELPRASAAFASGHFAQAAGLFTEADRRKEPFTAAQRDEWAYCRLHAVAVRLNGGNPSAAELAELGRTVDAALSTGSARLRPFGDQLAADLRRRNASPDAAATAGSAVETPSFRVHSSRPDLAVEVGRIAEAARRAMYERWAGPPAADWSPKCDIHLHPTAADYSKATAKPAEHPGHATVGTRGGQVVSRRVDLRADGPNVLDGVLPHEVTQVLLADLFVEQPLPRWAAVGMAALSESPEGVARYQRAVPGLLKDKKMFAVGPFLDRGEFPDRDSMTAFYAESVSLVSYLVELKGPKAFAAFVREAPRRGYARALATHYGFKDSAELQSKWVKHCLAAE